MDNIEFLISNMLDPRAVDLRLLNIFNKRDLITHLAGLLFQTGHVRSVDRMVKAVYEREKMGPTFVAEHVAFPHGESDTVMLPAIAIGKTTTGIFYETDDGQGGGLANIIVLIALPRSYDMNPEHISALRIVARLLVQKNFRESLFRAVTYEDVLTAFREFGALLTNP